MWREKAEALKKEHSSVKEQDGETPKRSVSVISLIKHYTTAVTLYSIVRYTEGGGIPVFMNINERLSFICSS